MFFPFFAKLKKNEKLVLLIDVGSASVGAALVEIGAVSVPRVITTMREDISFQEKLSPMEFLRAMNQSLDRVLKTAREKSKNTGTPAYILCSLSSPWFLLKSRQIVISQREPFEITAGVLDKILDDGVSQLKEELKGSIPMGDMRVVEKKIIQTKLNGYEIKNPFGQKATRIEMVMTVGISSKHVTERIERTVSNFFHNDTVHFGAFPVAAFSAIRDIFPTEKSFIFLDITGESTDVSLINNNLMVGTVSFPRGKNFFIREISAQFRMPHEAAASVLNMFLGGTIDTKREQEIIDLVMRAEKDWVSRLEKAIASLAIKGVLSHKIFFMTDDDVATLFAGSLGKVSAPDGFDKKFNPQYINQPILEKFVAFAPGVVRDPFLVVEALLAAKIAAQLRK